MKKRGKASHTSDTKTSPSGSALTTACTSKLSQPSAKPVKFSSAFPPIIASTSSSTSTSTSASASTSTSPLSSPTDTAQLRQQFSGFMRFANDRIDEIKLQYPTCNNLNNYLIDEWNQLSIERKKRYLDAAEKDKKRCTKEISDYKQSDAYKEFVESFKKKQGQMEPPKLDNGDKEILPSFDIPIFTDEFLKYNKSREVELRGLRKQIADLQQGSSLLQAYMENARTAADKLSMDTAQRKNVNAAAQDRLNELRLTFLDKFANMPLPGTTQPPTFDTIDDYVRKITIYVNEKPDDPFSLQVRDIMQNTR